MVRIQQNQPLVHGSELAKRVWAIAPIRHAIWSFADNRTLRVAMRLSKTSFLEVLPYTWETFHLDGYNLLFLCGVDEKRVLIYFKAVRTLLFPNTDSFASESYESMMSLFPNVRKLVDEAHQIVMTLDPSATPTTFDHVSFANGREFFESRLTMDKPTGYPPGWGFIPLSRLNLDGEFFPKTWAVESCHPLPKDIFTNPPEPFLSKVDTIHQLDLRVYYPDSFLQLMELLRLLAEHRKKPLVQLRLRLDSSSCGPNTLLPLRDLIGRLGVERVSLNIRDLAQPGLSMGATAILHFLTESLTPLPPCLKTLDLDIEYLNFSDQQPVRFRPSRTRQQYKGDQGGQLGDVQVGEASLNGGNHLLDRLRISFGALLGGGYPSLRESPQDRRTRKILTQHLMPSPGVLADLIYLFGGSRCRSVVEMSTLDICYASRCAIEKDFKKMRMEAEKHLVRRQDQVSHRLRGWQRLSLVEEGGA